MDFPKLEIDGLSIVLIGSFNPSIFHPQWLVAQGLISQTEAKENEKDIQIVSQQVSSFKLNMGDLSITPQRFQVITTKSPYFEKIRDLVIGMFEILQHTPIFQMGINWERHYKFQNDELWHEFGHKLAPQEPWKNVLTKPGLFSLQIQSQRTDSNNGHVLVTVAPSQGFSIKYGTFLQVNDHFDVQHLVKSDPSIGCIPILKLLKENWYESQKLRDKIVKEIIGV
jgi:hypothetical protein